MIQLFRKIRQRLLQENRFSKYLLYAIGEIVLVVIGILIALRINNWNEDRKLRNEEKETIASLQLEFEKNLVDLEDNIQTTSAIMNAGQILLDHMGPEYEFRSLKNVDSLISMTPRMAIWDPSLYTLSNIKNSGKLSKLHNEELKVKLIEWETFYSNLLDWGDFHVERGQRYFDYLIEHSNQRRIMNYGPFDLGESRFESNSEELMRNPGFESILAHRVAHNGFMLNYYMEAKEMLLKMIELCENYED